ncbi:MAG TPA: sigma-70 family RNA polymerase sigma factor [Longimicrobiaceae bacterium]
MPARHPSQPHAGAASSSAHSHSASSIPATDEERFVCYARNNCGACFRAIHDVYEPLVRRRARSVIGPGDPDRVDDVTQDIFIRIMKAREKFDPARKPFAHWLNKTITNALRNHLRDHGRHLRRATPFSHLPQDDRHDVASTAASPAREAERSNISDLVWRALRLTSVTYRHAFERHHIDGLTYREAAEIDGVHQGSVKAQCHRACKHLREQIGDALREHLQEEIYQT